MLHPLVKLVYAAVAAGLFYYLFPYTVPFLVALVLAVLVEPVVVRLEGWLKVKRIIAVTITFIGFLVISLLLLFLGLTRVVNQLLALFQQLPAFIDEVARSTEQIILKTEVFFEDIYPHTVQGVEQAIRDTVNMSAEISKGTAALVGTAKAIPETFVVIVVTLVSFYLFSLQLGELKTNFLRLFTPGAREKVNIILHDVNRAIVGFVRAQLIISLFTYLLILAGLLILKLSYPMAMALLIVLVDVLPILGTGFIMLPWGAFLLLTGKAYPAVGIVVLYVLIIVFRRILEPKILGQNIGLSPLATVISMYLGYRIMGISGFFLGPALGIIFKAMRKAGLFQQKIDF